MRENKQETTKAIEDYLNSGGTITKITDEDIKNAPVRLVGGYRKPRKQQWSGRPVKGGE